MEVFGILVLGSLVGAAIFWVGSIFGESRDLDYLLSRVEELEQRVEDQEDEGEEEDWDGVGDFEEGEEELDVEGLLLDHKHLTEYNQDLQDKVDVLTREKAELEKLVSELNSLPSSLGQGIQIEQPTPTSLFAESLTTTDHQFQPASVEYGEKPEQVEQFVHTFGPTVEVVKSRVEGVDTK